MWPDNLTGVRRWLLAELNCEHWGSSIVSAEIINIQSTTFSGYNLRHDIEEHTKDILRIHFRDVQ